jgi:hypothetical protein
LAANDNRLAPPPFWRTDYFRGRDDPAGPSHDRSRRRETVCVEEHHRWRRVIIEPDGETVDNAFFDRNFRP